MSDLRAFGERLWIADGPRVRFLGVRLPTRMVVFKLADGSLRIDSPVEATAATFDAIDALGPVKHLVAPTPLHVWRLDAAHARYPNAERWEPSRLGDVPPAAWAGDFDQVVFRGNLFFDEVEFFHRPSATLIVTDFIQSYPARRGDVLGNLAKRIGGVLDGGVPRDARLTFVYRKRARRSLSTLLSWDFDRVVLAHGDCVERDGKAVVRRAFGWLGA